MARFLAAALALPVALTAQHRDSARLAPGVSLALAQHRARTITDVHYDVTLAIPARKDAPVTGTTMLRFTRRANAGSAIVDFDASPAQVLGVEVNGRDAGVLAPVNGHLVIPASRLRAGANRVTIRFVAGDVPLNRDDEFLYTIFVPARARQAMPVFDQPDLKARWTVTLEVPRDWATVANGAALVREPLPGERVRVRFAETKPLPTYLVAVAAGRFRVDSAVRDGRTLRMFHREGDTAKVARNRDDILDLHARALRWMEDYTGIPHPWEKLDVFLAPAFQFGGMEHPGAIFYNAPGLMLDTTATQAQRLGRASVIAHEVAHLWFGDLVTMRWFDDVWLKEVFANFYAAKIVEPAFPQVNHALRFLLAHHPAAYDVDRTAGANPIRQPLDNLAEAGSLYGAIIYQKAPVMMRQLERLVGERPFRDAMRSYLRRFAYGNASWPELVAILDARTPADLAAWSRAWVTAPGRPELAARLVGDGATRYLELAQRDPRGRGLAWPQQVTVAVADDAARPPALTTRTLRGAPLVFAGVDAAPRWILPSAGGLAYGDVVLDPASRAALLADLPSIADPLTRGSALVTLFEETVAGRVAPAAMRATLLAALATEGDELLVARALGYLEVLWARWLDPEGRRAGAIAQERVLAEGLARAATPSLRLAWFRTLARTAETEATVARLARIARREERVSGLVLGEDDETALALQLAVREVRGWRALVEAQRARITNPDRRARLAFVAPAVSDDAGERARWFASLAELANRRREPWVLDGLALLHHPLRASASAPLVPAGLALLEELQRTGDIFFPKRWLDATLGGHRTRAVADAVHDYLRTHPGLAPRLRALVLQSADDLFRITGTSGG